MTLVLLEKGLVLEGSTPKIEDKQVPGVYYFICHLSRNSLKLFLHLGSGDLCEHHRLCHGSTISRWPRPSWSFCWVEVLHTSDRP